MGIELSERNKGGVRLASWLGTGREGRRRGRTQSLPKGQKPTLSPLIRNSYKSGRKEAARKGQSCCERISGRARIRIHD